MFFFCFICQPIPSQIHIKENLDLHKAIFKALTGFLSVADKYPHVFLSAYITQ